MPHPVLDFSWNSSFVIIPGVVMSRCLILVCVWRLVSMFYTFIILPSEILHLWMIFISVQTITWKFHPVFTPTHLVYYYYLVQQHQCLFTEFTYYDRCCVKSINSFSKHLSSSKEYFSVEPERKEENHTIAFIYQLEEIMVKCSTNMQLIWTPVVLKHMGAE